jgi:hypothetical protein
MTYTTYDYVRANAFGIVIPEDAPAVYLEPRRAGDAWIEIARAFVPYAVLIGLGCAFAWMVVGAVWWWPCL